MSTSIDIKDLMESQQNAFKLCMETLFLPLSQKVDEQATLIIELRRSLEFTQSEFQDAKKDLLSSKSQITKLETVNLEQSNTISELEKQLSNIEDHSRRVNVRIDGIAESPKETWEQTYVKVKKLLSDTMQLPDIQIDHAHRIISPKTKDSTTKPRTIIARLEKFTDRQLVFKNKLKLKNSNIYINDDVSDYTNKLRKEKLSELKAARNEGKIAYFNRSKLIIKSRTTFDNQQSKSNNASGVSLTPPPAVSQLVERFTPGNMARTNVSLSTDQQHQDNAQFTDPASTQLGSPETLQQEHLLRRSSRNK